MTSALEPSRLDVVGDPARAAVLLDPLRRRLLGALREQPDSAAGLARRLGQPRQKLNYHLRELEQARFVELVEERRKGNCVERVLGPTARHVLVDPTVLGAFEPEEARDRFSASVLVALAARAIREVAALADSAGRARKRLATVSLEGEVRLARPADLERFAADLAEAIGRVVAHHHDEEARGGRRFRLFLGAHPAPARRGAESVPHPSPRRHG